MKKIQVGNEYAVESKNLIQYYDDFPKKGIRFADIFPVLELGITQDILFGQLESFFKKKKYTYIACIESRGFLFGMAIASKLKIGIVPIRKAGKLPIVKYRFGSVNEYSIQEFEMAKEVTSTDRILVVDDVIATGGTLLAIDNMLKDKAERLDYYVYLDIGILSKDYELSGDLYYTADIG